MPVASHSVKLMPQKYLFDSGSKTNRGFGSAKFGLVTVFKYSAGLQKESGREIRWDVTLY